MSKSLENSVETEPSTSTTSTSTTTIKDNVVLITGANRGIGKALVEACLEKGAAKVYTGVRTLASAQPLVDRYGSNKIIPLHMDMLQPETIEAAAKEIASDADDCSDHIDDNHNNSKLRIVIHNAGILSITDALAETAVPQLQHELEVNVYSVLHMARHFSPFLKDGGVFCQMNSASSMRCLASNFCTTAATKAASYSITQSLRLSLKEQGTRVVSVHPGPIQTDLIGPLQHLFDETQSPEACASSILEAIEDGTTFLCYPDAPAKQLGTFYQPFATYVFEKGNAY